MNKNQRTKNFLTFRKFKISSNSLKISKLDWININFIFY